MQCRYTVWAAKRRISALGAKAGQVTNAGLDRSPPPGAGPVQADPQGEGRAEVARQRCGTTLICGVALSGPTKRYAERPRCVCHGPEAVGPPAAAVCALSWSTSSERNGGFWPFRSARNACPRRWEKRLLNGFKTSSVSACDHSSMSKISEQSRLVQSVKSVFKIMTIGMRRVRARPRRSRSWSARVQLLRPGTGSDA